MGVINDEIVPAILAALEAIDGGTQGASILYVIEGVCGRASGNSWPFWYRRLCATTARPTARPGPSIRFPTAVSLPEGFLV